jgi:hypothetical protein
MRDKKTVILIILSIFAAVSLFYGITSRPGKRTKGAYTNTGENPPSSSQAAFSAERRAKRSRFTSWRRNPFLPSGVSGASSDLVLNGILNSGGKLKAMIGSTVVANGDKIGANTVVDIKKDRVILNDGTKDFELTLHR